MHWPSRNGWGTLPTGQQVSLRTCASGPPGTSWAQSPDSRSVYGVARVMGYDFGLGLYDLRLGFVLHDLRLGVVLHDLRLGAFLPDGRRQVTDLGMGGTLYRWGSRKKCRGQAPPYNAMSRSALHYRPSLLEAPRQSPTPRPQFWVVTCYFNPCNYRNRLVNYARFAAGLRDQRVNLLTVQLRRRSDELRLPADSCTILVDVVESDVLWAKERLLNIGLAHLPPQCTQVCWCDCDVVFAQPNWAATCSELLHRHRVVQPFDTCLWLGPGEQPTAHHRHQHRRYQPTTSFARDHVRRQAQGLTSLALDEATADVYQSHPGYAWAARREVLERIAGLCDVCILGHADLAMALAFAHNPDRDGPLPPGWSGYWQPQWSAPLCAAVRQWQQRAAEVVRGDIGCARGHIYHLWHGPKKNRQYHQRAQLLHDFDPAAHLQQAPESHMWQWTAAARAIGLDQRAARYFAARQEDTKQT